MQKSGTFPSRWVLGKRLEMCSAQMRIELILPWGSRPLTAVYRTINPRDKMEACEHTLTIYDSVFCRANITLLAALSLQGMGEALMLEGSANSAVFEIYKDSLSFCRQGRERAFLPPCACPLIAI